VLVLCPTRELAMQVAKAAMDYGRYVPGLSVATIVGGVPYPAQLKALRGPLDILIATPAA
jgi:superfamily II DNA/RNA helicase